MRISSERQGRCTMCTERSKKIMPKAKIHRFRFP
jgi:hypothetical protein